MLSVNYIKWGGNLDPIGEESNWSIPMRGWCSFRESLCTQCMLRTRYNEQMLTHMKKTSIKKNIFHIVIL